MLVNQEGCGAVSSVCKCSSSRVLEAWPFSRCVLLQLRVLERVGCGFERFGVPQWAEHFYKSGLAFLSHFPRGTAGWRIRFLCGRARLTLAGFSVSPGVPVDCPGGESPATCSTPLVGITSPIRAM